MDSLRGLGNALSDAGKQDARDDTSGVSSFVALDQGQRRPSVDIQTAHINGQRQHAAPRRNMSYDASTFSAREPGRKPPWTLAEEASLAKWHSILGNRWAAISKYLPGRSENDVKNMWHSTVRAKSCRRSSLLFNYCRAVKDCSDDATARRAAFELTQQQCAGSPLSANGGGPGVGATLAAGGAAAGGGAGGPVRMLPTKRSSASGAQQLLGLYAAQSPSTLLRGGHGLLERPFSGPVPDQLDSGILGSEPLEPAAGHDSMNHLDYSPGAAVGGSSRRPRAATATGLGLSGTCDAPGQYCGNAHHPSDHYHPGTGEGSLAGGPSSGGPGALGDGLGGGQPRDGAAFGLLQHSARPASFNGVGSGSHSPQQLGYSRMGLQHQQQHQQQQVAAALQLGQGGLNTLDRATSMPHRTSIPGNNGPLGLQDYARRVDGNGYDAGPNSGGSAALGGYGGSQSGYAGPQYVQHPPQQQQQLMQLRAAQQQQQQQHMYASSQLQLQQQHSGRYDSGGSGHGGPSRLAHMLVNTGDGSQHSGMGPRSSQDLSPHHHQHPQQAFQYQQQPQQAQYQQLAYAQQQQQEPQRQFEFHQQPQAQYVGCGYSPAPQQQQQQQPYGMHAQQQQQQQHRTSINGGMSLMSIDTDSRPGPDGPKYRTSVNGGGAGPPLGPDNAAAYADPHYQQQQQQQQYYQPQQQYQYQQQQQQQPRTASRTLSTAGMAASGGFEGQQGDGGYAEPGIAHAGPDAHTPTAGGGVPPSHAPYGASSRQSRPSSGPSDVMIGAGPGGPGGPGGAVHMEQQQQQQQARAMAMMALAAAGGSQRGSQRGRATSGTSGHAFDELDALLEQIDVMEDSEALTLNYLAVAGGSNRGAVAAQQAVAAGGSVGGADGGHFDLQPQPRYQQEHPQQAQHKQQYQFPGLAPASHHPHGQLQDGPGGGAAAGHTSGTAMLFGGGCGGGGAGAGAGGPGGAGGRGLLGSATFSALLMNVDGAGGAGPAGPLAGGTAALPGSQRGGSMNSFRHQAPTDVVTMGLGDEDIAGMMAALAGGRGQGGQAGPGGHGPAPAPGAR